MSALDLIEVPTTKDMMLISAVRMYRQTWGVEAGKWAAEKAGLSPSMTDIAMDETADCHFYVVECTDLGCRILCWPFFGMPKGSLHSDKNKG